MDGTNGVVGHRVAAARRPSGRSSDRELRREHLIVPVHGLLSTDPDGIVEVIACRDGTVIPHLSYGDSRVEVRLDICRAAQLSTGIWEAAGTASGSPGTSTTRPAPTIAATPTGRETRRKTGAHFPAGVHQPSLLPDEHGQCELTLSEIVALANAVKIAHVELITLPILAHTAS